MGNTFNAIMSLVYFRLIKKARFADLKLYQIGKDAAAWFIFVILFLFCTASTAVCLSYTGGFLVDGGYCLSAGAIYKKSKLFVLWLALCMCLPSLFTVGFFFAGTIYLKLHTVSNDLGPVLVHLRHIQIALKYSIIS